MALLPPAQAEVQVRGCDKAGKVVSRPRDYAFQGEIVRVDVLVRPPSKQSVDLERWRRRCLRAKLRLQLVAQDGEPAFTSCAAESCSSPIVDGVEYRLDGLYVRTATTDGWPDDDDYWRAEGAVTEAGALVGQVALQEDTLKVDVVVQLSDGGTIRLDRFMKKQ